MKVNYNELFVKGLRILNINYNIEKREVGERIGVSKNRIYALSKPSSKSRVKEREFNALLKEWPELEKELIGEEKKESSEVMELLKQNNKILATQTELLTEKVMEDTKKIKEDNEDLKKKILLLESKLIKLEERLTRKSNPNLPQEDHD